MNRNLAEACFGNMWVTRRELMGYPANGDLER